MKKAGKVGVVAKDIVVFDRGTENCIKFDLVGLPSMKEFDKLVPMPKPPLLTKPGQTPVADPTDKAYLEKVEDYAKQRVAYMIIQGLSTNDDLEWTNLNPADPKTWHLWEDELEEAGLTLFERMHLVSKVMSLNGADADTYKEAKNAFLAMKQPVAPTQ